MKNYRVTCLFQADWIYLVPALFGTNQPDSYQVAGNIAVFNFSYPVTPSNLGPLVLIEESHQPFLFD